MIEMVTLAEERLKRGRKAVFAQRALPQAMAPLAEVAPILRGACASPDDKIEGAWRRLVLEFRTSDAILDFVNGKEVARYARAGVVDARPHHPHQELAADRAGAGGRQARRLQERGAAGGERLHRQLPGLLRAQRRAPRRQRGSCSTRCRASSWCRGSACSASAAARPTRRSPPISPRARSPSSPTRRRSAQFQSIGESDMFECEYWPPEQAKLGAGEGAAAGRPDRGHHRRAAAPSARRRRGPSRRPARRWRCSTSTRRRPRAKARSDRRVGAGGCLRRDGRSLGARGLRQGGGDLRRRRHRRVERGRGLAGPHRRGRRGRAAQELRAQFLRPPARGADRRAHHAGAGHRRLPAVQRLQAGGEPRPQLRPLRPAQGGHPVPGARSTRSTTAPTASAPTPSTPTASAPACSPTISSRRAPRRAG